jgi:hypothetical protein
MDSGCVYKGCVMKLYEPATSVEINIRCDLWYGIHIEHILLKGGSENIMVIRHIHYCLYKSKCFLQMIHATYMYDPITIVHVENGLILDSYF